MNNRVRQGIIIAALLALGVAAHTRPASEAGLVAAQAEATATVEDFSVVPPGETAEGEEATATATPETAPIVVEQVTATPEAELPAALPEGWNRPINLSRSGATDDPQMVRDSGGNLHVLWQDGIDGFVYTTGGGEAWSDPVAPELPFATRFYFPDLAPERETPLFPPVVAADNSGSIHALWIDTFDGGQTLYHSSVRSETFEVFETWTPREVLDLATGEAGWSVDEAGNLHIAYVRPVESAVRPSGVYYRRLNAGGGWSDAVLLYASRYLRGVDGDEANVQVLADGAEVFVVWDDTGREQVYLARSTDGGLGWEAAQEIDRRSPEDDAEALGPGQITVGSDGQNVLISWSGGHEPGIPCAQYVSFSGDRGASWSLRQHLDGLPNCLTWPRFVTNEQGVFLMGTSEQAGAQRDAVVWTAYLLAWDGNRWSDPQVQEPLTRFTNPDTFQQVELSCLQGMGQGSQLLFLGCDAGNGEDIWLIAREVGNVEDWFPPPSVWVGPEDAGSSQVETHDLQLVVDLLGGAHAFWRGEAGREIYHAGWNGQSWSAARPVLQSPRGEVQDLAAAAHGERLYLAWRDSASGLQFSQAAADRPSEWSEPMQPAEAEGAASAPSLAATADGRLLVAYAVPLNEERGIYLLESRDGGVSWREPRRVFDGTAAGWEMVDQPRLGITGNGQLQLMWTRRSLPPEARPLGLAYSRSEDGGRNWTEAEVFTEAAAEWTRLVGVDASGVHRLWAEENNERLVVWHEVSLDGGATWSRAQQVTGVSGETEPAVAVDAGNRAHLLALENGRLLDFLWSEERWAASEDLEVPFAPSGALAAVGDRQVQLLVLYGGQVRGAADEETEADRLYSMWRPFDIPPELIAPLPTPMPSATPTATPEPTAAPQPTATAVFTTEQQASPLDALPQLPGGLGSNASLIVLAIVPAALIVLLAVLAGVRAARKR